MNTKKQSASPQPAARQANSTSVSLAVAPMALLNRRLGNAGVRGVLQAKMSVSDPQDPFEMEADRVADQVMRMPDAQSVARSSLQIQRVCNECEEDLHRDAESSSSAPSLDAATESAIGSLSSRGSPLPDSTRSFMESRFQTNFEAVRVHTDSHAHDLARSVSAKAFTVGREVVFGAGHYAPETEDGKRLLAHELTHVLQQSRQSASAALMREPDSGAGGAKPPMPKPGQTPFNFISESPALENWKVSVKGMLEREFDTHFDSFEDANGYFKLYLEDLPTTAARESFADRMRDRARKAFFRQEARNPSYKYDNEALSRMRNGAAPTAEMQLEHMEEVKTKTRAGQVIQGHPERALDPANIYVTEGGAGGTAPLGSKHAEKQRTIDAAKRSSQEIRERNIRVASEEGKAAASSPGGEPVAKAAPAVEPTTKAEVGAPIEPVVEATPGFKAEAASGIGGAIQLIQAMQFHSLQRAEVEKFAKRYEELQPKIAAFLANGYSVELILIVEKPDRPDIFCATGAFCDSGQFIYFHDLFINYVDTPRPILNVKPRESTQSTMGPAGGGGGFIPSIHQGGSFTEENKIRFIPARHAEHHCEYAKQTLLPQATVAPLPATPQQQPAPLKPKPPLDPAAKKALADGPARVYALSANVVQYKTAAEVVKKLSGNPLFGAITEVTGGGLNRAHTIIDYRSPLDKAKAEALAELVRASGVPTATAELTGNGDGDPGVLQIWFGRDAEK
jgi:hypothetical protein